MASAKISTVLFDLDDTLNDRQRSWEIFVPMFQKEYAGRLGPCDDAQIGRAIAAADQGGYRAKDDFFGEVRELLPWRDRPSAAEMEKFWRGCFADCMVERTGAGMLLRDLRRNGLSVGIVSNGRADMQRAKIAQLGFDSLVDTVLISEAVGIKKPDPRIFAMALDALQCEPEAALFVGDHPTLDVAGAQGAGMRAAWLKLDREWKGEKQQPEYILSSLDELRPILEMVNQT